ncbi:MAG: hypothetical protein HY885_01100 [Deltaproteobacteria bacterium]|nr:hypothetical protein [Deltaproteobacteria bacterium]
MPDKRVSGKRSGGIGDGSAIFANFRDFSGEATGGALAPTAAGITVIFQNSSSLSGIDEPFHHLLLFQRDKLAVESRQTMHVSFTYDGIACIEVAPEALAK